MTSYGTIQLKIEEGGRLERCRRRTGNNRFVAPN